MISGTKHSMRVHAAQGQYAFYLRFVLPPLMNLNARKLKRKNENLFCHFQHKYNNYPTVTI